MTRLSVTVQCFTRLNRHNAPDKEVTCFIFAIICYLCRTYVHILLTQTLHILNESSKHISRNPQLLEFQDPTASFSTYQIPKTPRKPHLHDVHLHWQELLRLHATLASRRPTSMSECGNIGLCLSETFVAAANLGVQVYRCYKVTASTSSLMLCLQSNGDIAD